MSRVWDKVSEASTLMFADSEFAKTTQCMIGGRKLRCHKPARFVHAGWLGSRVVSVLDSGAEGPGSNRSRDAVG